MQKTAATQFVKRLYTELWNQPNPAKVDEFYHQDLLGYFGTEPITFQDIKQRALFSQQVFASIHTEVLDIIAEDNQIAARLKQTVVRKSNNEKVEYQLIGIYRLRDNKISQLWFLSDKPFDYKEKI